MQRPFEFLNQLKTELNDAPNNGTAEPRFWVIADYKDIIGNPEYENCETYIYLQGVEDAQPLKQFIEGVKSDDFKNIEYDYGLNGNQINHIKHTIQTIERDNYPPDDILKLARQYIDSFAEVYDVYKMWYIVPNTLFLTEADAQDYLAQFGYNHSPQAHVYGMMAYRSPKYEQLLKTIKHTDW